MVKLFVCIGSACHLKGSYNIIDSFQKLIEKHKLNDKVELSATFCLGHCQGQGVSVKIDDDYYPVPPENARAFFESEVLPRVAI